LKIWFISELKF